MYTFEEMQAVATAAQQVSGIVSTTGQIKTLATVRHSIDYARTGGEGGIEMSQALGVTFDWVEGRWQLSQIERY